MIATPLEHVIVGSVGLIVILGCYEVYFIFQRLTQSTDRSLETVFDGWFRYRPSWVWIYSVFYYAVLVSIVVTFKTYADFVFTTASYVVLLFIQITIFTVFPVSTPAEWRYQGEPRGISERLLQFVQRIDARSNCFPSMHTSVAVLTAFQLHWHTSIPLGWTIVYPVLIGLSALFTKQHFFLDIVAALFVGFIPYVLYLRVIT